jgi:hypothetical protein
MKASLFVFVFLVSLKCQAQVVTAKNDTLLKKQDARLALDNGGIALNHFVVRGDIYVTQNSFIFHPKPYRKKRYGMYNDLVKDIMLPYDSILVAKKIWGGLILKTNTKKFIIGGGGNWNSIVSKINQLKKRA